MQLQNEKKKKHLPNSLSVMLPARLAATEAGMGFSGTMAFNRGSNARQWLKHHTASQKALENAAHILVGDITASFSIA